MKVDCDGPEQPAGLILACPTGTIYTNQADGVCCQHPEVEGAFIPLPYPGEVNDTLMALSDRTIDGAAADMIDGVLGPIARVDRDKLAASMEAWVHVLIGGGAPGVLYWQNSD